MKYIVLDLETNGTETFKRFCNPLDPRHSIELAVFGRGNRLTSVQGDDRDYIVSIMLREYDPKVIVGQNVKFDLMWLWGQDKFQEWLANGGLVWDTQTVEYLLQGQTKEKRNLDTLAARYGGTVKDDRISYLYKCGYTSKEISDGTYLKDFNGGGQSDIIKYRDNIDPKWITDNPPDLLEYCRHDVRNTDTIFQAQYQKAKRLGMLPLIKTYMKHYIAVCEMEWNGLHINQDKAWEDCAVLEEKLEALSATLVKALPEKCWDNRIQFLPSSSQHISVALFGGQLSFIYDEEKKDDAGNLLRYKGGQKAGQVKTKRTKGTTTIDGFEFQPLLKPGKTGYYSCDIKVLKGLLEQLDPLAHHPGSKFLKNLIEYREIAKLLGTYYYREKANGKASGNLALLHPHTECIHTEFKTSETRTGRLASRNPNIQNLAPACLEIFDSRFEGGKLIEFDFSQLEVVVQAALSGSPQFMQDVRDGIDFHCLRLSYAVDKPYREVKELCDSDPEWALKRKKAKIISFQKAYGAQPERIAREAQLPLDVVKNVFDKEDRRYPEVAVYYESILDTIKHTSYPLDDALPVKIKAKDGSLLKYTTFPGEPQRLGHASTEFNKRYAFYDRGSLTKNHTIFRYYLMTEVQDYPIQGTASDIVALFVGELFTKHLHKLRNHTRLVNEVHDSILLDCEADFVDTLIRIVQEEAAKLPDLIEKRFGFKWPLPLKLDCSVGNTWMEIKKNG